METIRVGSWRWLCGVLAWLIPWAQAPSAEAAPRYFDTEFVLEVSAGSPLGIGTITIDQDAALVPELRLRMPAERYRLLEAEGEIRREPGLVYWVPPVGRSSLRYEVVIENARGNGYDGLVTADWAIFRGDDVFPTVRVVPVAGSESRSRLILQGPAGWKQVAGYRRRDGGDWIVHNPGWLFDRPRGWVLMGRLGIRRETIAGLRLTVAAPLGAGARRVAMLALLNWNLPWLVEQSPLQMRRLLIASGPEPLWRGGLSAPNSLFLRADLPLIGEDGSSTLLHEAAHVLFPVDASDDADWIDEGLAEYLSVRALLESGGLSPARYRASIDGFRRRGQRAPGLEGDYSSGDVTARAVALFHDLNEELVQATGGRRDLMDLVRRMMSAQEPLDLAGVRELATALMGAPPRCLAEPATATSTP